MTKTGEIVLGASNPNRYIEGTSVTFPMQNLNTAMRIRRGWVTNTPIYIEIGSVTKQIPGSVEFDIALQETLLPINVFNAVLGSLTLKVNAQIGRKKGVPDDVVSEINLYAGELSIQPTIPCKDTAELSPFKINGFEITREMLFDETSKTDCLLRVSPQQSSMADNIVL